MPHEPLSLTTCVGRAILWNCLPSHSWRPWCNDSTAWNKSFQDSKKKIKLRK